MAPLPYGAVYCDLDATLLDPTRTVTPRTRRVLDALRSRGVHIGVATGRTLRSARAHITAAGALAPAILLNGARVQSLDGTIHLDVSLPSDAAEALVRLARRPGVFMNCYHGDTISIEERNDTARQSADKDGVVQELCDDLLGLVQRQAPTKIMMIAPADQMPQFEAAARDELRRCDASADLVRSEPTYLEALAPGVSKGAALPVATRLLGLRPDQVVAFGDGLNDLELLQAAGLGLAMANAHPHLRSAADDTCDANDRDGVAVALEKIFEL